ncbi:MAG: radical SAM family protein [Comamonadaceae bacterium]|nr:MAG: radical SAM family protein [Comamonadaceae bacterium]
MTHTAPRIILATLNARYIHASLGLRYLLANLDRHGGAGLRAQTVLREYTISRAPQEVVADLITTLGAASGEVQIIGFGVYIWNVTQTLEVIRLLKAARPDARLVLGGPEVSHEVDQQPITQLADHVITGWGDVSFAKLCRALLDGPQPLMKVISGEQPALTEIALPYTEYSDADLAHRLLYVEASRGCPFKCEFCLSSLDKTAWGFELDRVLLALDGLYRRGARNFKFVDRTFNLKMDHSVRILQFFLDRLPAADAPQSEPLSLHFEVIPDHLPERLRTMLAQFPPGVLQLEVGVQSFNPTVQHTISRRQDNTATEANLRWLLDHSHAHLHADLIFGLPGETLQSFADGFDRLLALDPHEIQLGILKRLRGTPIARHTEAHGMVYATEPPYTVQHTAVVDAATLQRFARFARYWDLLANSGRFAHTLVLLLQHMPQASAFWRFMALSDWLWQHLDATHKLTPEVLVDALFEHLSAHMPPDTVRQALLADYMASGARANPKTLQGLLPRQAPASPRSARTLALRQDRHRQASLV